MDIAGVGGRIFGVRVRSWNGVRAGRKAAHGSPAGPSTAESAQASQTEVPAVLNCTKSFVPAEKVNLPSGFQVP